MTFALPPTYLLQMHLSLEALHGLEDQIPTLTYDITEAKLVLGKVTTKQRALFELRSRKLWTEEVLPVKTEVVDEGGGREKTNPGPLRKRRRIDDENSKEAVVVGSSAETKTELVPRTKDVTSHPSKESTQSRDRGSPTALTMSSPPPPGLSSSAMTLVEVQPDVDWGDTVKVVKLAWFTESLAVGHLLPLADYLVYEGKPIEPTEAISLEPIIAKITKRPPAPEEILSRAQADSPKAVSRPFAKGAYSKARHGQGQRSQTTVTHPTHLVHQTSSEYDDPDKLPPIPDYLHTTYSCQRPTPLSSLIDPFIGQLKKIRMARILFRDEIGVRAYSTAIASLAAYPYTLSSPQEVLRLPGCDQKIAALYQEWKTTGRIAAVDDIDSDPKLQVLNLFYEIWGVGAVTAQEFYNKGWRDLDDIVEFGWSTLTRVQQIGVKYYDEFQLKIPRAEVESISSTILSHANKICPGFHMCIVGGYRRGKAESGDVDVILSHPDETVTLCFVQDIVAELEKGSWITHTLLLSMANSERNQTPVSWKGNTSKVGSGFDTLDKALVVWQNPNWPTCVADLEKNPKAKNPNVHRRVDIIISPWKTAGCAIAGWTSGTTFQRDLRRYAKKVKNLKFDSSGIRSREDGQWVDFESVGGKAKDLLTAEKRVFEGLGLEWREPNERCTG